MDRLFLLFVTDLLEPVPDAIVRCFVFAIRDLKLIDAVLCDVTIKEAT
jgi:hypothetical protein